ncbi:MAG: MerR family transcriptional regulator, partial [Anaerolineae bacterium]|nr:MerR family transcriptional regulator [Anaerolineae bacterium]
MFKIGDFSRISQVSVKTLRYYDEIGLLKPAHVDRFIGYRYYSVDQLGRLHRILALKGLGLSLEQVTRLLDDHLTSEQIRGMLRMKRAEMQQRVEEERERLARKGLLVT